MKQFLIAVVAILLFPGPASGNGFEFPSNGAVSLGRGGAFVARADDLVAIELNPAGLIKLPGTHFYIGNNISMYNAQYTPLFGTLNADGTLSSTSGPSASNDAGPFYAAPFVALSSDFGLKGLRVALGAFGPSAYGRTSFNKAETNACFEEDDPFSCISETSPQRYMIVNNDTLLAMYTLSVAYGVEDKFSFGISGHWMDLMAVKYSLFVDAFNPDLPFSADRYDVQADLDVADRMRFAFTIGGWWKPLHYLEVGASFRTPVAFNASGGTNIRFADTLLNDVYVADPDPTKPNGFVVMQDTKADSADPTVIDVLGSPSRATGAGIPTTLAFNFPMAARFGVRYMHNIGQGKGRRELFDIEFNAVWEGWSALDKFGVSMDGYMVMLQYGQANKGAQKLYFKSIDMPKNYEDSFSFRLGGDYNPLSWLSLRAGTYYETAAVPKAYTHLDFAGFERIGASCGISVQKENFKALGVQWRKVKASLAYSHIFQPDREVALEETKVLKQYPLLDAPPEGQYAGAGAGKFETSYDILSLGVTFGF